MIRTMFLFAVGCAMIGWNGHTCRSQEGFDEAAMQKWTEFMAPGEPHQALQYKEGTWDAKVTMWMAPGAPPQENAAKSESKMIMGGRYLIDHVHGTFNGMPFEGIGTSGYDNHLKQYVYTWIDNMGTGVGVGRGNYDVAKKTWNYTMEMTDPMTGKTVTTRSVDRIVDDNTWVMESFANGPDGKEYKNMEITYQRKK